MKIDCPSWRDIGLPGAGACTLNKFGGRPSRGTCAGCLGVDVQQTQPVQRTQQARLAFVMLTVAQQRTVESRRAICNSCEYARRVHRLSVHCEGCGCAGLSLLNGRCPRNKWPAVGEDIGVTTTAV